MGESYTSLGLMSGTSMDGVDASIIKSDGNMEYSVKFDKYFEYDDNLRQKLLHIRDKICTPKDLKSFFNDIEALEREITIFNAKVVNDVVTNSEFKPDLIGFHGQTIFHDPKRKITKQLGSGKLLSQLTKKLVVFDFRQNDLKNGGQGAPLAPIFHNTLANKINEKFELEFPIYILNIGGIANVTGTINIKDLSNKKKIYAFDIGPGNCLIDEWIRNNSNKKYDKDGLLAGSGQTDKLILNQALENFHIDCDYEKSLDIKNFDIFFAKGLSLENGAATITDYTAKIISDGIAYIRNFNQSQSSRWLVCGGGRKNKYLLNKIRSHFNELHLDPIDKYKIDGDFVESQAFAYLAIRTLKKMPISFPGTTRCKNPSTGGIIAKNF